MSDTNFRDRFFHSTRGRIVILLRVSEQTVNDLARTLELTDNGVRAHLLTLERDGLVRVTGSERGLRKPNTRYGLTASAEELFPKAYGTLLGELLNVLADRVPIENLDEALREVGRRMASDTSVPGNGDEIRERLAHSLQVLISLGGLAAIDEGSSDEDVITIRGLSCPLKNAVAAYPNSCAIAESLLTSLIGAPVKEKCVKGPEPKCVFEVQVS